MRVVSKTILSLIVASTVLATAATASAFPPQTITGIDLPTVLTLDDHARRFTFEMDGQTTVKKKLKKVHTIVIDPGHGGDNLGALGVADIQEKYLTLELAYRLRDRLQAKYPNVRVLMTRYWDQGLTLTERVHFANLMGADVFMSLHYNAARRSGAEGFETYFLLPSESTPGKAEKKGKPIATAKNVVSGIDRPVTAKKDGTYNDALIDLKRDLARQRQNQESGLFAQIIQRNLARHLHEINRGVKQANYGVLRGALMPAVVVESAFLTNPKEGEKLTTEKHRRRVVKALVAAIEQFDQKLAQRDAK